jgi:hypothetical protein
MLSPEYAGQVRDVAVAQLEDVTRGLNVQLAITLGAAGLPVFAFDWSATSINFFEVQLDPGDIESTTPLKYPLCTLSVLQEDNQLDQTYITFSGQIVMELCLYISFIQSGVPRNVEKTLNAVTAAVIRTFCDSSAAATANFTGPVTFNRKLAVKRSRLQMGAQNWRVPIKFYLPFGLDTN